MSSRRKFIATSASAALAASMLPTVGSKKGRSEEGGSEEGSRPEDDGAEDSARAFRRARGRASAGQSVPFPES